jgi:hypothetical protein
MPGLDLLQSESQQFCFTTGLRKHTIHGLEGLVVYCIPRLIEACPKNKAKRRPRAPTHNRRVPSKTSKPRTTGEITRRRSERLTETKWEL